MDMERYSIGLDYGTNSLRGILVRCSDGAEIAAYVYAYQHGEDGIIQSSDNSHLARQHPQDYIRGLETILSALVLAMREHGIATEQVCGIGIDTTGSTPIPVDRACVPLAFKEEFRGNPNALAWLWKDHTAAEEAAWITSAAHETKPDYTVMCGGVYSSEWFFSKIFHCLRVDQKVFDAAWTWLECCDFIVAHACGIHAPEKVKRSICAAGHKALFSHMWNGLPSEDFLHRLHPALAALRPRLYAKAYTSDTIAGYLRADYKEKFGFTRNIPVAVGGFDAHFGAVGSRVRPGVLVKIVGTSTCDITVTDLPESKCVIPGVSGVVNGSVIPGLVGIEAGQSAVGDILNWFVRHVCEQGDDYHKVLSEAADRYAPGSTGLLGLDWNNGNRTILVDARLTGLLLGQTLHTGRAEIYRALIEATAFGARKIVERLAEYHVPVDKIVACGGIARKNPLFMQIYADVLGMPIEVTAATQACALGAAIFGAVVGGVFPSVYEAQKHMCPANIVVYKPRSQFRPVYNQLYDLYSKLHDAFGIRGYKAKLAMVMKDLLAIKEAQRSERSEKIVNRN